MELNEDSFAKLDQLRLENKNLKYTIDNTDIYVYLKDRSGRYLYVNKKVAELFDSLPEEIVGKTDELFFDLTLSENLRINDNLVLNNGERIDKEEKNIILKTGEVRYYHTSKFPLYNEIGNIVGLAGFSTDITELKKLKDQFEQLANTDTLTNIMSRRYLIESAERELSRCQRQGNKLVVIMFDIDNFKNINDEYGHVTGDNVLVGIANICSQSTRKYDLFGRYGGDEFVMVLPDISEANAQDFAERLRMEICNLNIEDVSGIRIKITVSMGLALAKEYTVNFEEVLSRADTALYSAKSKGRNCWQWDEVS